MFPPTRSEMPRYPQFSEKWAVDKRQEERGKKNNFFLSERFFFLSDGMVC